MPSKKIQNPEIGKVDCPCCGAVLPLRVNMNGCAYLFCNNPIDGKERCFYRVTYGKKKSRELIESYSVGLSPETQNNQPETEKNGVNDGIGLQEYQNQTRGNSDNGNSGATESRKSFFGTILSSLDD